VQHHRFGTAHDDRKFDRIFVLSVVKQSKEKKEKNNKKKKYKNVDFFIFLILNPTTQGLSGGLGIETRLWQAHTIRYKIETS